MPSFNMINHSLIQINQHSYSVKILEDFISNSEEEDDELKIAASERFDHKINKIEVKNLSFSYDSNKQIIKNNEIKIDFNFKKLISPYEVLESPDSRKLGILVKNIKISPV